MYSTQIGQKKSDLRRGPGRLPTPGGGGGNAKCLHGWSVIWADARAAVATEAWSGGGSWPLISLHTVTVWSVEPLLVVPSCFLDKGNDTWYDLFRNLPSKSKPELSDASSAKCKNVS